MEKSDLEFEDPLGKSKKVLKGQLFYTAGIDAACLLTDADISHSEDKDSGYRITLTKGDQLSLHFLLFSLVENSGPCGWDLRRSQA